MFVSWSILAILKSVSGFSYDTLFMGIEHQPLAQPPTCRARGVAIR